MPLLGANAGVVKFAKWLLTKSPSTLAAGALWLLNELNYDGEVPEEFEWRRYVFSWTRLTPSGTVEDRAQFKLDLINVTADELDASWTSGDYTAVAAAYTTFVSQLAPYCAASQVMGELKAYRKRFNPAFDITKPFADTGMPVDVRTYSQAGTQSGATLPYQVSPTVTFRTPWAKHWGRVYLPTPTVTALDTYGRLTSTYRTGVGNAVAGLVGTLHDGGFYPVIPVGQVDKQPFHGLLGIRGVFVDDVPDIQRRRRSKQVAARYQAAGS